MPSVVTQSTLPDGVHVIVKRDCATCVTTLGILGDPIDD